MSEEDTVELKRELKQQGREIVTLQINQQHMNRNLERVESVLERVSWLIITAGVTGLVGGAIALVWSLISDQL